MIHEFTDGALAPWEAADDTPGTIDVADSWLVSDGRTLGLELHRTRFLDAVLGSGHLEVGADEFWTAAIRAIPLEGDWFPRVELRATGDGPRLLLRLREAPARTVSTVLATYTGEDPRTAPRVKGPDLDAMLAARESVRALGADEAVILEEGYVVEGAYSGLLWWRGNILCGPLAEFDRVDSVTARAVLTLASALGIDTHEEAVTPAELDGTELWAVSALHGIRIATAWADGPQLAEQPGRLATWRKRLERLRRPIG